MSLSASCLAKIYIVVPYIVGAICPSCLFLSDSSRLKLLSRPANHSTAAPPNLVLWNFTSGPTSCPQLHARQSHTSYTPKSFWRFRRRQKFYLLKPSTLSPLHKILLSTPAHNQACRTSRQDMSCGNGYLHSNRSHWFSWRPHISSRACNCYNPRPTGNVHKHTWAQRRLFEPC